MKLGCRLALLAVPASIMLIIGPGPVPSAGAAAQKADLHLEAGRSSCPGGGTSSNPLHGFAILNETENSEGIITEVSLKDGAPNTSYDVHVIQCQGDSDLPGGSLVGTFETDGRGNGTFHGDAVEKSAAADHAFVGLFANPDQIYATVSVPI